MKIVDMVYTGEVQLVDEQGVYYPLSNEFKDIPGFCHSIEAANRAEDVQDLANYYELYSTQWYVFDDTVGLTWLISEDSSGNVQYLKVYKRYKIYKS